MKTQLLILPICLRQNVMNEAQLPVPLCSLPAQPTQLWINPLGSRSVSSAWSRQAGELCQQRRCTPPCKGDRRVRWMAACAGRLRSAQHMCSSPAKRQREGMRGTGQRSSALSCDEGFQRSVLQPKGGTESFLDVLIYF